MSNITILPFQIMIYDIIKIYKFHPLYSLKLLSFFPNIYRYCKINIKSFNKWHSN